MLDFIKDRRCISDQLPGFRTLIAEGLAAAPGKNAEFAALLKDEVIETHATDSRWFALAWHDELETWRDYTLGGVVHAAVGLTLLLSVVMAFCGYRMADQSITICIGFACAAVIPGMLAVANEYIRRPYGTSFALDRFIGSGRARFAKTVGIGNKALYFSSGSDGRALQYWDIDKVSIQREKWGAYRIVAKSISYQLEYRLPVIGNGTREEATRLADGIRTRVAIAKEEVPLHERKTTGELFVARERLSAAA